MSQEDNLNKINGNKDLYDRLCTWMTLNRKTKTNYWPRPKPRTSWTTEEEKDFSLDEAMEIMYAIRETCEEN